MRDVVESSVTDSPDLSDAREYPLETINDQKLRYRLLIHGMRSTLSRSFSGISNKLDNMMNLVCGGWLFAMLIS